ncbi:Low molecular weight protein tyrosine phosphatase (EC [uncultured Gammaproteobacteria bacterium]|nr:Low molecular weight protein tyrosine phosphatase (EC 3.1.3.48) [uncultured Gammaproteobacteria bacterium]CAC9472146.1 Low molecular weight protein tyrosine phosphatase (EC 3.1.3.48) [uncultured Gammaproteobacteria bacterium]VVH67259.1 Low molecular weight protein tyrosine phosphatase (EC [uncultured Gammaproteobacteria bacterium]
MGKNWILLIIPIYAKVSTYKYDEKNCINTTCVTSCVCQGRF